MAGIIGAIKKDLFHDGAKVATGVKQHTYKALPKTVQELGEGGKEYTKDVAYSSYKLTDKLGKYVASGGVIGSGSTMAFTAYENYREGNNLADGMGASALRGAALGSIAGGALNLVPKVVHNTLASSGITSFKGGAGLAKGAMDAWSPLMNELGKSSAAAKLKANSAEATKDRVLNRKARQQAKDESLKKFNKMFTEAKKELKAEGKDYKANGDLYMKVVGDNIEKMSPTNLLITPDKASKASKATNTNKQKFSIDDAIQMKSMEGAYTQSLKNWEKFTEESPEITKFQTYLSETVQDIQRIQGVKRYLTGGALAVKMGFDSAVHHIVEPTGQAIDAVGRGAFKELDFSKTAAMAFTGYGLYEAGSIVNDASEGNWGGVAMGMGMLAGGKLMYGVAMDVGKLDAMRRMRGISDAVGWQGFKFHSNMQALKKSVEDMSEANDARMTAITQNKAWEFLDETLPNSSKDIRGIAEGDIVPNDNGFTQNLALTTRMAANLKKDLDNAGVDSKHILDRAYHYGTNHYDELNSMALDFKTGDPNKIMSWGSRYGTVLNSLEEDIMDPGASIDYQKAVIDMFGSGTNQKAKMKAASDILFNTKVVQARRGTGPAVSVNSSEPDPMANLMGFKMASNWVDLGGGAALGTLSSYALDRYINGEDASIAPHLLTGAVFQAASAGHMISMYNQGTRELAKNTAKTAVKAAGDIV